MPRIRPSELAARRLLMQATSDPCPWPRGAQPNTLFPSPRTLQRGDRQAVNAHFSWGPMYETEVMLDWLFAQDRARRPSALAVG